MGKVLLLFIVAALLVYGTSVIAPQNKAPKSTNGFITADGQSLYDGTTKLRSIGVNRYNLLTHHKPDGTLVGCANSFSEEELDGLFSEMEDMGITTVRFWLFQSFTQSGKDLSRFDYVLKKAEQHNIRLIPVLENHWHDCTQGDEKSASWYASEYTNPYGGYSLSLKDYIKQIVPKYKDNSTILAWEIMNEANSTDSQALYDFAKDVSSYTKSLDSNHLVTVGLSGARESAEDYKRISQIETIDILDYHDYDEEQNPYPDKLAIALGIAKELNKPLVLGEAGINNSFGDRANLFDAKIKAFFDNGGSIYLLWSYGEKYITNDGFNFESSDPVADVIRQDAKGLK